MTFYTCDNLAKWQKSQGREVCLLSSFCRRRKQGILWFSLALGRIIYVAYNSFFYEISEQYALSDQLHLHLNSRFR